MSLPPRTYTTIKIRDEPHNIRVITLSRPAQRNAFTDPMADDLVHAFESASRDASVRAVVLVGDEAGKAFCAGADLGGGSQGESQFDLVRTTDPSKSEKLREFKDGGGTVGLAIMRCLKPVIAAVNGAAVGVGLTMPCTCDMRVVQEDAKVGFPFVRRGLACETISSWTLPRLVGLGKANELVLTGRIFAAKDAPPGLFNYILPKDQVFPKAMELAKEISQNASATSVGVSKAMLMRGQTMSIEETHEMESKAIFACITGKDNREGIVSFLEKRLPKFQEDAWKDLPKWFPWPRSASKL